MATPAPPARWQLRQYFTDGYHPSGAANHDGFEPSAALLRAVINGAHHDRLYSATNGKRQVLRVVRQPIEPAPSPRQGWGRIDLAKSVPLPSALNPDASTTVANSSSSTASTGCVHGSGSGARSACTSPSGQTTSFGYSGLIDPPAAIVDGALVNDLDSSCTTCRRKPTRSRRSCGP